MIPKFRAWHKKKQKYMEVKSIDFEKETITLMEVSNVIRYTMVDFNEVILEQYIGEVDINGVELHLGDIIKYAGNTYQIIFESCEFIAVDSKGNVLKRITEGVEKIGNIHENKELLD